jgi:hypothetical protein
MSQKQESKAEEKSERMIESVPMSAGDPVATAAVVSVVYSWFKFYVRGDKQGGIFVGLWAPTLLAAASYLQQKDVVHKIKDGFSSL